MSGTFTSAPGKLEAFPCEAAMTEPMRSAIANLHTRGEVHMVAFEQRGALKIPDLVAATLCSDQPEQARDFPLRESHVRVLEAIHRRRPLHVSTVSSRSGLPESQLRKTVVPFLCDAGLITQPREGLVVATPMWAPRVRLLTAIELKLRNWQRALHQAFRMQRSVDYSWVVLDEARASAALNNLHHFEDLGVGLATLSARTGEVRVVRRAATVRHSQQWMRSYFAEQIMWDQQR